MFPCYPGPLPPAVMGEPPLPPGQEAGRRLRCRTGRPQLGDAGPQLPALRAPAELAAATAAPGSAQVSCPRSGFQADAQQLGSPPHPTPSSGLGDPQPSGGGKINRPLPLSAHPDPGVMAQACGLGWPGHRRCPRPGFPNSRRVQACAENLTPKAAVPSGVTAEEGAGVGSDLPREGAAAVGFPPLWFPPVSPLPDETLRVGAGASALPEGTLGACP